MKRCSLCCATASVYCESDKAILCWDCDAKVHGANFLVARHSRCLLCRGCGVPTPWTASGPRLCPSISVCDRCSVICDAEVKRMELNDAVDDDDDLGDSDDDDDDSDEDDDDDDGDDLGVSADDSEDEEEENQVVPWGTGSPSRTPPPIASSYSSSDESTRMGIHDRAFRRTRDNDGFHFSTSSHLHHPYPKAPPSGSLSGGRATSIGCPSFPRRVPNEVAPPGLTLSQLNCRGNHSPSSISQI